MSDTDGRMRTRAAFRTFYEKKKTKANAKAIANKANRAHAPGKNTYEIRERHLRHLQEVLERENVTHIGMMTQDHVDAAFEECVESMAPRAGDEVSPNTVRNVVTSFRSFIRFQIDNGAIPAAKYAKLTENLPAIEAFKRRMLIIPGTDWPDIFTIAGKRHIMDRVILELAFYLAMRISEARSVRWMDLDLDNNDVQFFRDKRNDYLKLDVHPDLKATLLELQQWLTDMGIPPEPHWPIVLARVVDDHGAGAKVQPHWPCKPGVAMDPNTARRALREALLNFGILPSQMICQGMHIARRSRACHLYRSGVDIRIIAKVLGHKSYLTTLDYIRDGLDENEIKAAMNLPLRTQDVELYTGSEQPAGLNVPAVPQSKDALATAMLTMLNSGILSEEESRVVLMRMMNTA